MPDADTRNKRASAIGIDFPWQHTYPNPDGTINQADRQQTAYKYSGILASSLVVSTAGIYRTIMGVGA